MAETSNMGWRKFTHLPGLGLLLLAGNALGQASFSVTPTKIYFEVPEGGTGTQTLTVRNNGSEEKSYTVTFQAWERNARGERVFYPDTGQAFSIARMLTAEPPVFNLAAGDSQVISVKLNQETPQRQPSLWAMLLVKELNPNRVNDATGGVRAAINVEYQLGVHVYQHLPGISARSTDMVLDSMYYSDGKRDRIHIKFRNAGETIAEGQLKVQVFAMDTGKQIDLPIRSMTFLPNRERTISVMLPQDLEPGDYTLTVAFDSGFQSDLVVGDLYFQVAGQSD